VDGEIPATPAVKLKLTCLVLRRSEPSTVH
jgi:hypothetical protein